MYTTFNMTDEPDIVTAPESALGSGLSVAGSTPMREFLRYFLASAIALFVDVASLFLMTELIGIPYLIAGGAAFLLGLVTVYFLSVAWVFEYRATKSYWFEFLMFAGIGIVGLGLNELLLYLLTGLLGWHLVFSKGVSILFVFSWNFIARKRILFAHE